MCPSCPFVAKTWPFRVALRSHMMSKHGWRETRSGSVSRDLAALSKPKSSLLLPRLGLV